MAVKVPTDPQHPESLLGRSLQVSTVLCQSDILPVSRNRRVDDIEDGVRASWKIAAQIPELDP